MNPLLWSFPLALISMIYLDRKKAFPLSRNKFLFFWLVGLIGFLIASYLTGIGLSTGLFEEKTPGSKIMLRYAGTIGLYAKVLVFALLLIALKKRWPNNLNVDGSVIIFFFAGIIDAVNDIYYLFFW
jgi:hypothetical protein